VKVPLSAGFDQTEHAVWLLNRSALSAAPTHDHAERTKGTGERPEVSDQMRTSGPGSASMHEVPAGVAQLAERPSCKRQVSGSIPLTGSQVRRDLLRWPRLGVDERALSAVCAPGLPS
jgi:hypothetical protein